MIMYLICLPNAPTVLPHSILYPQRLPESGTEEIYNDDTDVPLDEKYFLPFEHFEDSLPYFPPGYKTETQYERPCYFSEIPRRGEQYSFKEQKTPTGFLSALLSHNLWELEL